MMLSDLGVWQLEIPHQRRAQRTCAPQQRHHEGPRHEGRRAAAPRKPSRALSPLWSELAGSFV
jgi:hypothetical protein